LKSPSFRYIRPDSIDSTFELLDQYGDNAKILAGGQSLLPSLNMRLSAPEVLIDISQLSELKQIKELNNELHVGSLVRHCEVEESKLIASYAPLLSMALPQVAHRAVRSRGTFGGSIAFADAASETPAMVLAHEATLVVRSSSGERLIAANDFFLGLYETALKPQEILIRAEFKKPVLGERYIFKEIARRKGDYATVGLGIRARFDKRVCHQIRIIFFAIADKPIISSSVSDYLLNQEIDVACIDQALNRIDDDIQAFGDTYHDEFTKIHLMKILLKRALIELIERN
jgi:aerobic carbon-monoxide dehydrogenase medium subunit